MSLSDNILNSESNDYNERRVAFEAYKDTLPKEPSGDVKKEYCVGCFQKSDWEFIHEELMKDGSLEDNIPTDRCDCVNDCLQSEVRGTYLLTETEATELRANPKVDYVNINVSAYPGTYAENPDNLSSTIPDNTTSRYESPVINQQNLTLDFIPGYGTPTSSLLNTHLCSGYSIHA